MYLLYSLVTLLALVVLALQALPMTLGTYRERGILRRMSTTPVHPGMVLAQEPARHGEVVGPPDREGRDRPPARPTSSTTSSRTP